MRHERPLLRVALDGAFDGPSNAALDRRLLAAAADAPEHDLLRLYRFTPTASVGRHQALARELRLDYCRARGIAIVRRLSGGGALYLDENQLAFSLVTANAAWHGMPLAQVLERLAVVVARALRGIGIAAQPAAPNDVEVAGRKIASVYAVRDAGHLLANGFVLLEANVKSMLEALRVPTEKLSGAGIETARARFATVAEIRGALPRCGELETALIDEFEQALGARASDEGIAELRPTVRPDEREFERQWAERLAWNDEKSIEAVTKTPDGVTLRARARFSGNVLGWIELATDAHVEPADFPAELAAKLRGVPAPLLARAVHRRLYQHGARFNGVAGADITALLRQLLAKERLRIAHGFELREVNALMLLDPKGESDATRLLSKATVMLVPYCAKPAWCKWRHRDGCPECGLCEVGEAYGLARERGMDVVTITNYEHLVRTLRDMKARSVSAYVGMCCSNFFVKRHRAFAEAAMPAVLMDVSGANCYELKQEDEAYAGTFRAEAKLDRPLLERVIAFVPPLAMHAECKT